MFAIYRQELEMNLRYPVVLVCAFASLLLPACGAPAGPGEGSGTGPTPVLDCERDAYPCTMGEVDPAVLELEGRYTEEILQRVGAAPYSDALPWIRAQPEVVEAEAGAASLMFRLEGGRPAWLVRPLGADPTAPAASSSTPTTLPTRNIVVGHGTDRDDDEPDNRKRALLLTPFSFDFGPDEYLIDLVSQLRGIPDYGHAFADVDWVDGSAVTPYAFGGEASGFVGPLPPDAPAPSGYRDWRDYDAIFLHTHGGQYSAGTTFLATGVYEEFEPGGGEAERVCERLMIGYEGVPGVVCGTVEIEEVTDAETGATRTRHLRTLGVETDLFRASYPEGLDRALVFVGGCLSLASDDLANVLKGNDSAYLGWTDAVRSDRAGATARALFERLLERGEPVRTALAGTCADPGCGGPAWNGPDLPGEPRLEIRGSETAKSLRLYDLPALKDPGDPTSTTRLEDGATLQIIGAEGDGVEDELVIVVDVAGVIDPENPGGGGGSSLQPQQSAPAGLYDLRFFVDDEDVGADNLGDHRNPTATVSELDDTTYRYAFTADLGFDVPEGGKEVALKVEVPLPEGGVSDHEVEVTLRALPCRFDVTFSGGLSGSASGPASFELDDGGIEVVLDGHLTEGTLGDALRAGVFAPDWGGVPGAYSITQGSAARFDATEGPTTALWLAGDPSVDCAGCGGTLTIERAEGELVVGSYRATLYTMGEDRQDPPPPTTVTATFEAVSKTPYDPFDAYSVCTDAWSQR